MAASSDVARRARTATQPAWGILELLLSDMSEKCKMCKTICKKNMDQYAK